MSFQDLESGRPLTGRRDPSNGRQDPTQAIVAGLFQITTAVRNFERLVNTIGTPKDTPELREKLYLALFLSLQVSESRELDHVSE
ncbi:hypothetical protein B296_00007693 [Ensete ventricosum]|uniref:Syntaxin N-terminal domain-containing protein n=1 Tax=Ensete ventricosum TaxID=4639 RepID=A0A427ATY8_ENSVE|nr:hypothetical protein B296_00007693 [Ensete ventricosum]